MRFPDRSDRSDRSDRDGGESPVSSADDQESAQSHEGDGQRRRARIKSPGVSQRTSQPRPEESSTADLAAASSATTGSAIGDSATSVFVHKGQPPRPRLANDDETLRHMPDVGLNWLGTGAESSEPHDRERSPKMVKAPRKTGTRVEPDLHGFQQVQGSHVGDRYVRVVRQHGDDFSRAGPGHLVATEE